MQPSDSSAALDILYEHRSVLVLNKPNGLLTQAPPGIDSLEIRLRRHIKETEKIDGKIYLVPVHRLDRPVSGAIVFARNVRSAKRLSEQFRNRTVEKTYHAIVEGSLKEQDRWVDYMRKIVDEAKSEIVPEDDEGAKQAILKYRVLATVDDQSMLEIELETGRTHQIRLQCSSREHPIVGDALYSSATVFGPQTVDLRERQIGLHARKIVFEHPIEHDKVEIVAPYPAAWHETGFELSSV